MGKIDGNHVRVVFCCCIGTHDSVISTNSCVGIDSVGTGSPFSYLQRGEQVVKELLFCVGIDRSEGD